MLTPSTAAVKFDLPLTPEQQACSMHIDEGLKMFWSLVEHLQHAADEHQPIDQVEETIFRGSPGDRAMDAPGVPGPSPVQGMSVRP